MVTLLISPFPSFASRSFGFFYLFKISPLSTNSQYLRLVFPSSHRDETTYIGTEIEHSNIDTTYSNLSLTFTHEKQKPASGKEPEEYVTGSEVANPCV